MLCQAKVKFEGFEKLKATLRSARRQAYDAFQAAAAAMNARLREELAGGRGARRAYDVGLTATEVLPEKCALPPAPVASIEEASEMKPNGAMTADARHG